MAAAKPTFNLTRPDDKDPKKRMKIHGSITFNKVEIIREDSFLDFIKGLSLPLKLC